MKLKHTHILYIIFTLTYVTTVSACSSQVVKNSELVEYNANSELVEYNANIAIKDCGKDNVKSVSINGYKCK